LRAAAAAGSLTWAAVAGAGLAVGMDTGKVRVLVRKKSTPELQQSPCLDIFY
jgi:hypothetical protein